MQMRMIIKWFLAINCRFGDHRSNPAWFNNAIILGSMIKKG